MRGRRWRVANAPSRENNGPNCRVEAFFGIGELLYLEMTMLTHLVLRLKVSGGQRLLGEGVARLASKPAEARPCRIYRAAAGLNWRHVHVSAE